MALQAYLEALKTNEDLMLRALIASAAAAKNASYASMKEEDWRKALRQPAQALMALVERHEEVDSLSPAENSDQHQAAACGTLEAQRQRACGMRFELLLGLGKLVRQVLIDLARQTKMNQNEQQLALAITHRFWDEFELGFSSEWFRQEETKPSNEKLTGGVSIPQEIADRKRIDLDCSENEERLRSIIENTKAGYFFIDAEGLIQDVNDAWIELYKYSSKEEILGQHFTVIQQAEDVAAAKDYVAGIMRGDAAYLSGEFSRKCKDGSIGYHVFSAGPVIHEGRTTGIEGFLFDTTGRKQAEEALRESEERYRNFVVNASEGIYRLDFTAPIPVELPDEELKATISKHALVSEVNEALAVMYGIHADEMVGRLARDFAPEYGERALLAVRAPQYQVRDVETEDVDKNGKPIFLAESYTAVVEDGMLVRIWGMQRDITERKRAAEALQESEEQLSSFYSAMQEGVCLHELIYDSSGRASDYRIIDVNPAYETITGFAKEQAIGSLASELYGTSEPPYFEVFSRVASSGKAESFETYFPPMDKHFIISVICPRLGRFATVFTDITDIKRAEANLQAEKAFGETIFNAATDTIFVFEPNSGMPVLWNRAFRDISGFSDEEIRSMKAPNDWYAPEDLEQARQAQEQILEGKATSFEMSLITKGVRPVPFQYQASLISDPAGQPRYIVAVGRDLTDQKRTEAERQKLEAQVQHAQKLESLGVLAGGIAHDFNNLLMAVLGNADIALQDLPPASPARPLIEEVLKGARRGAELAGQMLAYSGKGAFVKNIIDLRELLSETTHLLEASIPKTTSVRFRLPDKLPSISADVTQLRQVIMNLILNAAEAVGDEAGFIMVKTGARVCDSDYLKSRYFPGDLPGGNYVYLDVIDNGCGMDEEALEKLFDPFYTTKFTGRGLGLAATLGIIRGHEGAVKVESELGKGASFRVLFPVVDEQSIRLMMPGQQVVEWKGEGTVLLVDDEQSVRDVGERMLTRLGFKVLLASDGEEGVELFRQYAAELKCVLLDVSMPKMGGERAFEEMTKLDQDAFIIMSSGYSPEEVANKFAGKNIAGFIQKPYTLTKLKAKLQRVLGV